MQRCMGGGGSDTRLSSNETASPGGLKLLAALQQVEPDPVIRGESDGSAVRESGY